MIGQISSSGKLGNSLFQFYFLKKLCLELNQGVFHSKWNELNDFSGTGFRLDEPCALGKGFKKFGLEDLENAGKDQFLSDCRAALRKRNILLSPGILGSHFFDFANEDPRQILRTKETLRDPDLEKPYIALHFRGLDFHEWNPKAVMDIKYYKSSISNILTSSGNIDYPIKLVTDDPSHPLVGKVLKISKNVSLVKEGSQISDFRILARSKFLVASPSTFAFWGGLLGPDKTIVHSRSWVESRAEAGDLFWAHLLKRERFYGHRFLQF